MTTDTTTEHAAAPEAVNPNRAILTACVKRMKAMNLSGKARDDAANHFLAAAVGRARLRAPRRRRRLSRCSRSLGRLTMAHTVPLPHTDPGAFVLLMLLLALVAMLLKGKS